MAPKSNTTLTAVKRGDYRGCSLNESEASRAFSDMILEKMRESGGAHPFVTIKPIKELLEAFHDGRLDVFPEYQRGVVSNLLWAQELVTVLVFTSAPINPIYLYNQSEDPNMRSWEVVDGAQRLTAIFLFMLGAFPIRDGTDDVWFLNQMEPNCGWMSIFDAGGASKLVDHSPFSNNLLKFYEQARHMVVPQGSDHLILKGEHRDHFLGRAVWVSHMPAGWTSELSILYMVYTSLKMWKQTKDECLVHLHDRASRQLKDRERQLNCAIEEINDDDDGKERINFKSPTRQSYGVVAKVFACLAGIDHVPMEADERSYSEFMVTMINRYSITDPDPDIMLRIVSGMNCLVANKRDLPRTGKPVPSDHLVAIIYTASSPTVTSYGIVKLVTILQSPKKTYADLLKSWNVTGATVMASELNKFSTQYSDRNLVSLCGLCLRLSERVQGAKVDSKKQCTRTETS